jgi:hypothetical protein
MKTEAEIRADERRKIIESPSSMTMTEECFDRAMESARADERRKIEHWEQGLGVEYI